MNKTTFALRIKKKSFLFYSVLDTKVITWHVYTKAVGVETQAEHSTVQLSFCALKSSGFVSHFLAWMFEIIQFSFGHAYLMFRWTLHIVTEQNFGGCFRLKQQYLFIRQILYKFCSNKAFKNPYILKKKKNAMDNNSCMAVLNTAIYFKLNFTLLIRPHNLGKKVNHNSKNWCCHATVLFQLSRWKIKNCSITG